MTNLECGARFEVIAELHQRQLGRLPNLVAEVPIALNAEHIQIDITSLRRVRAQAEAHRVRAAFRNTVRVVRLLSGLSQFQFAAIFYSTRP